MSSVLQHLSSAYKVQDDIVIFQAWNKKQGNVWLLPTVCGCWKQRQYLVPDIQTVSADVSHGCHKDRGLVVVVVVLGGGLQVRKLTLLDSFKHQQSSLWMDAYCM